MITTSQSQRAVSEDRVAAIAYALWLDEGQPHDRAEAHWFRALEIANVGATVEIPDLMPKRKAAVPAAKKPAPRKRS